MKKNGATSQVIASLIATLIAWLIKAWALMLTLGIIHKDVYAPVRPIGYGWTAFALTTVISLFTTRRLTVNRMAIKDGPER